MDASDSGAHFQVDFIGSTCTALPLGPPPGPSPRGTDSPPSLPSPHFTPYSAANRHQLRDNVFAFVCEVVACCCLSAGEVADWIPRSCGGWSTGVIRAMSLHVVAAHVRLGQDDRRTSQRRPQPSRHVEGNLLTVG